MKNNAKRSEIFDYARFRQAYPYEIRQISECGKYIIYTYLDRQRNKETQQIIIEVLSA